MSFLPVIAIILIMTTSNFSQSCQSHDETQIVSWMAAPWRDSYLKKAFADPVAKPSCPFCTQHQSPELEKYLILGKYKHNVIHMNIYPYCKAHLLIIPYAHVGSIAELTPAARSEIMELSTHCTTILKTVYGCESFNIGFNIGKLAGASIPDHLHIQIVPRHHDEPRPSYMQTISNTHINCFDVAKVYTQLKPHFDAITNQ
jgi:Diadenosine tetraphosphate (Ap4A) hydrolase and other HIT family hydrolases